MKSVVPLFATMFLASCAYYWTAAGPELRLFGGRARPKEAVAIIHQGVGCWHCVQTIQRAGEQNPIYTSPPPETSLFDYPNKLILLPGRYQVAITHRSRKSTTAYWSGVVELKPGHRYDVRQDACYVFCFSVPSRTSFVWIEDAGTKEVVLGKKL